MINITLPNLLDDSSRGNNAEFGQIACVAVSEALKAGMQNKLCQPEGCQSFFAVTLTQVEESELDFANLLTFSYFDKAKFII